jgi:hypothetical protein
MEKSSSINSVLMPTAAILPAAAATISCEGAPEAASPAAKKPGTELSLHRSGFHPTPSLHNQALREIQHAAAIAASRIPPFYQASIFS